MSPEEIIIAVGGYVVAKENNPTSGVRINEYLTPEVQEDASLAYDIHTMSAWEYVEEAAGDLYGIPPTPEPTPTIVFTEAPQSPSPSPLPPPPPPPTRPIISVFDRPTPSEYDEDDVAYAVTEDFVPAPYWPVFDFSAPPQHSDMLYDSTSARLNEATEEAMDVSLAFSLTATPAPSQPRETRDERRRRRAAARAKAKACHRIFCRLPR